jgi:hypothetical protein
MDVRIIGDDLLSLAVIITLYLQAVVALFATARLLGEWKGWVSTDADSTRV